MGIQIGEKNLCLRWPTPKPSSYNVTIPAFISRSFLETNFTSNNNFSHRKNFYLVLL